MSSPFFMVLMRSLFHLPLQSIRAAEQLQVQIKQTWLGSWVKPASDEFAKIVPTSYTNNISVTTTGSWATVPEVDLSNFVPTFDYNGKVTIDGIDVYNDKTAINFRAEIGKLSMWLSTRINLYNTVVDNM